MSSSNREVTLLIHDTLLIVDCNDEACDLFCCDRDTLIGFSIFDLIYNEEFQGLGKLRMKSLRALGYVRPVEYVLQRFDGTLFCAHVTTDQIEVNRYKSTVFYKDEA
jgi:PAS domain-containing protein